MAGSQSLAGKKVDEFSYAPGKGITCAVEGERIAVGNRLLMRELGIHTFGESRPLPAGKYKPGLSDVARLKQQPEGWISLCPSGVANTATRPSFSSFAGGRGSVTLTGVQEPALGNTSPAMPHPDDLVRVSPPFIQHPHNSAEMPEPAALLWKDGGALPQISPFGRPGHKPLKKESLR